MPMNPEVKARWGAWLLEHAGQQGSGTLHRITPDGDTYCCLAGLCEMAAEEGVTTRTVQGSRYAYDGVTDILPPSVMEYAGLDTANPYVTVDSELVSYGRDSRSLADLNDQAGLTFPEIWALIEAQL